MSCFKCDKAQKHNRPSSVAFSLRVEFLALSQQVPEEGEQKKASKRSFSTLTTDNEEILLASEESETLFY